MASREEQWSSDILSWQIICFQDTKTCSTQPAGKLLTSLCSGGELGSLGLVPETAETRTSPGTRLFYGAGGINTCLLEGSISYTKNRHFNPCPGIFTLMRFHYLLKILLKCVHETHLKILEAV